MLQTWTQPTEQVIGIVKFQIKRTDTLSPKYTGQIKWKLLLTISNNVMLLDLNNFMKNRFIVKASDDKSDFSNGQASKS